VTKGTVLYAPNVHTGGGFVLLHALLDAWPQGEVLRAFLDVRARERLTLPALVEVVWVEPRLVSRFKAEISLRGSAVSGAMVFCFHGLPPLLPNVGRVVVFQQNRNYFGLNPLSQFSLKTRLRLAFERAVSKLFRHRVSEYVVQSLSMQRTLLHWYGKVRIKRSMPLVRVLPFADSIPGPIPCADLKPEWDFVYVSDGEAHKNHRTLLEAWQLLAEEGLRPSLALTLSSRDEVLKREVMGTSRRYGLRIHDLGQMSHEDVLALYSRSGALIFPSTSESFGLPLIEATQTGLPVLAPELDYVRDVCVPAQTFDPQSPVSIARAVKRFLGQPDPIVQLHTPAEFWDAILEDV
jgi:glycosyltransferase involved in cell wall biosynthesis